MRPSHVEHPRGHLPVWPAQPRVRLLSWRADAPPRYEPERIELLLVAEAPPSAPDWPGCCRPADPVFGQRTTAPVPGADGGRAGLDRLASMMFGSGSVRARRPPVVGDATSPVFDPPPRSLRSSDSAQSGYSFGDDVVATDASATHAASADSAGPDERSQHLARSARHGTKMRYTRSRRHRVLEAHEPRGQSRRR